MTPFIAATTPRGRELAQRLYNAKTEADFRELREQMLVDYGINQGGKLSVPRPADQFIFHIASAQREDALDRLRVTSYDAAGLVAMNAKAFPDALYALERAQELARCRDRQKRIDNIRLLLVARGELVPPAAPTTRKRRPARSSGAQRSTRTR